MGNKGIKVITDGEMGRAGFQKIVEKINIELKEEDLNFRDCEAGKKGQVKTWLYLGGYMCLQEGRVP